MKKLLLFLSTAVIASAATAQQRASSLVFNDGVHARKAVHDPEQVSVRPNMNRLRSHSNARTTSGSSSRWYNYGDYLGMSSTVAFSAMYLWNDTTSVDVYSNGTGNVYEFNDMVSVAYVCDPFFPGFNDELYYSGLVELTEAEPYTIDSVYISGIYKRNDAKTTPVDTLTIAVVYGDGSVASDLHYRAIDTTGGRSWVYNFYGKDSLFYMNLKHDSANNHADTFMGGFPPVIKKIYLTNTDTAVNFERTIPLNISVPAGNMPAVSVSFKSGDPTFVFGDTVFMGASSFTPYKYGMFRPFIAFEGTASAPVFPENSRLDLNEGEFRDMGYNRTTNGVYRPQWFWYNATTNGASTYQYPYFAFHASCPTCGTVGVKNAPANTTAPTAYPNPANSHVTISFDLVSTQDATVTISDMLGRQVAVQHADKTSGGNLTFSTATLPAGVYIYSINANGEHTTGRIAVVH